MGKGGEAAQTEKSARQITIEELTQHRTPNDGKFLQFEFFFLADFYHKLLHSYIAWLAYKGRVYDVSNWEDHPGKIYAVGTS